MTTPLWRAMLAASDAALDGREFGSAIEIDRLMCATHIEAVLALLFPDGAPPQPWAVAEFAIWNRLSGELVTARNGCTADAPSVRHDATNGGEALAPSKHFYHEH